MNAPRLVFLFALLPLLAGCETTESRPSERLQVVEIKKGMSAEAVRSLLGEPKEIRPVAGAPDERAEVWVYLHTKASDTRMVQVGSRNTPYIDPITGAARQVQDPIIVPETNRVTERLELLMARGAVVTWKQERIDERNLITQ